ncbi:unnamed protein product, partial [Ectocarpus fasciculatus]
RRHELREKGIKQVETRWRHKLLSKSESERCIRGREHDENAHGMQVGVSPSSNTFRYRSVLPGNCQQVASWLRSLRAAAENQEVPLLKQALALRPSPNFHPNANSSSPHGSHVK